MDGSTQARLIIFAIGIALVLIYFFYRLALYIFRKIPFWIETREQDRLAEMWDREHDIGRDAREGKIPSIYVSARSLQKRDSDQD